MTSRILLCSALAVALCSCGSQKSNNGKILAYMVTAGNANCAKHADATSCKADSANTCLWLDREIACLAGMTCPSGVCVQKDACEDHKDASSCTAGSCAWSTVKALCPAGADCASGGYCHAIASGSGNCACVSPVSCPKDAACPPMECDCAGGGGATTGGSCTCACAPCAAGETCPPCACDCSAGPVNGGCVDQGTCACACPVCPDNAACAPCDCGCSAKGTVVSGSSGTGTASSDGTRNCTCPACPAGAACAPCSCDAGSAPADPCTAHADAAGCTSDKTNSCDWYGMGACACPSCPAGTTCPPCTCGASGSCVHVVTDPCASLNDATTCAANAACVWYGLGLACPVGETRRSGVCQSKPTTPSDPPPCACACPAVACDKDSVCEPCSCSCGSAGNCTPPAPSQGSK